MHVAFDRGEHDDPFAALIALLHEGLEVRDGVLHRLGGAEHEGELHLSGGEQLADRLHACEQDVVDDGERSHSTRHGLVEVLVEPVAVAVDDPVLEAALDRPTRPVLGGHGRRARDALVEGQQLGQRVVAVASAVVDEIEADLTGSLVDLREREDLRGMHDRRVETGLDTFVEEDRVEHLPGRGVEAERDVGEPEHGVDAGELRLDPADALDGLDAVPPTLLHPGREGKGERVEEEVARAQSVPLDRDVVDRLGGTELPVGGAGLTLGVDAGADDRRAELFRQGEERVESGPLLVTLLEVDRIDDRTPADPREGGLDDGRLGRVDDQRGGRLGREPRRDLLHVGHTVGTGVVDADVDQVRPFLHLLPGHGDAAVPVAGEHRLAELLRSVRVGAFADDQERGVLGEGNLGVDRRRAELRFRFPRRRGQPGARVDHRGQVGGRRPAAATDHRHAELRDELAVELGELVRAQVVVHLAVDDRGQAGVREAGNREGGVAGEVAQGLEHLCRTGRAVEADHVDVHRLERAQRGPDLGSREHRSGQLDGHLCLQGNLPPHRLHRPASGVDGRLGLEEVEDRLDEDEVDAALEERGDLLLVRIAQVGVADLAEGRELGAGSDAAGDPPRALGRPEVVRPHLAPVRRRRG